MSARNFDLLRQSSQSSSGGPQQHGVGAADAPFPHKMYELLNYTERIGLSHVVSWLPHGRAFKIHDSVQFMNEISGLFFRSKKVRSVHRQLNLWGFTR